MAIFYHFLNLSVSKHWATYVLHVLRTLIFLVQYSACYTRSPIVWALSVNGRRLFVCLSRA